MKEIGGLLSVVILITIIFIAFGNFQSELSKNYDITYSEEDFRLANTTQEIVNISEEIKDEIEDLTVPTASLADKASAFIGGTMKTGRLVLTIPRIFTVMISEFAEKTQLPLMGITAMITLSILIVFIFRVLTWRRSG